MEILSSLAGFILACLLLWGLFWTIVFVVGAIGYILLSPLLWVLLIGVAIGYFYTKNQKV